VKAVDPYDPSYPVDHHIFPQQDDLASWFQERGIDIHDYAVTVTNAEHHEIHPTWNWEWEWFKDAYPDATIADIQDHAARMMEDYDILDRFIHDYREGTGAVGFQP
jgi:Predicted lipoprotein of unknown function (DUF2380)